MSMSGIVVTGRRPWLVGRGIDTKKKLRVTGAGIVGVHNARRNDQKHPGFCLVGVVRDDAADGAGAIVDDLPGGVSVRREVPSGGALVGASEAKTNRGVGSHSRRSEPSLV